MINPSRARQVARGVVSVFVRHLHAVLLLLALFAGHGARAEASFTGVAVTPANGTVDAATGKLNVTVTGRVTAIGTADAIRTVALYYDNQSVQNRYYTVRYTQAERPINDERSFSFVVPVDPGTHTIQLGAFPDLADVGYTPVYTVAATGLTNGAQVGAHAPLPATVTAGQTYNVSVTMLNTGTTTWATSGAKPYSLGSVGDNGSWNVGRVGIAGSVAPGAAYKFDFTVTAPAQPGTYNYRWQMVQDAVEWFGAMTDAPLTVTVVAAKAPPTATITGPAAGAVFSGTRGGSAPVTVSGSGAAASGAAITSLDVLDNGVVVHTVNASSVNQALWMSVGSTHAIQIRANDNMGKSTLSAARNINVLVNDAAYVPSQNVPGTMAPGTTASVSVTMKNTGTSTWSAGSSFLLGAQKPQDNTTWRSSNRVTLPAAVPPGGQQTFSFDIKAPAANGSYGFRWQMVQEFVGWFGAMSPDTTITVATQAPTLAFTGPVDGGTFVAAGASAAVPVTGTATAAGAATVSKIELLDNGVIVPAATAAGGAINASVALAPGPHSLQLRATDSLNQTATSAARAVTVLAATAGNGARFVSQSLPATMRAGQPYTLTVTMQNTGTTTWTAGAGYRLGAQNPQDNHTWTPTGRAYLSAPVPTGGTAVFTIPVTAPSPAATYNFQWRMVEENVAWFGGTSDNAAIPVGTGPGPAASLSAASANVRVAGTQTAPVTFSAKGVAASGTITKLELFQGGETSGFSTVAAQTLTGSAATLSWSPVVNLPAGVYFFKLRATDAAGVATESAPVMVNVTNSALLGLVSGVATRADKNYLLGWVCQSGAAAALNYQLLLDAPTLVAGATLLENGVANVATEPNNAAVQAQCATPGAAHNFAIDLSPYTQYAGRQLYVRATIAAGTSAITLPCADNNCTVPGSLRVGISTPAPGATYYLPNPVFLRMVVAGATAPLDEVAFSVNGSWMAAKAEADAPGAYSVSMPLAASATPYTVQAKVRQGRITLFSVQNPFTVSSAAASTVAITAPAGATTVAPGTVVALGASASGTPAGVRFFANGTQIGVATSGGGGWNYNWTPTAANTYSVLARSYDAGGVQLGESAPVVVTVSPAGSATPLPVTIAAPHLGDADVGSLPGDLTVTPTGAAAYSLPIVVPPGTAGIQPALSLEYNSSGQNDMVGLGWSLSGFSSIRRCGKTIAQDGENGRISYNSSDRLCLDGQRLVLANRAETDANYWAADAQYHTEIDSFSRISSQMVGGKRSFKVEAKNGRIMTYGGATGYVTPVVPARINSGELAPQPVAANKAEAQSWAVDRIEDRSGNYIAIAYKQIALTGEHYAVGIRYGGNGLAAHAGVVIEHEDRLDAWTRYIDETRNDLRTRVKSIKTYVGSDLSGDIAANGALVRTYTLAYERSATSGRSLLVSVEGCAYNAQMKKDECLPKTEFSWGRRVAGRVAGFESKGTWANAPHLMTWNDNFGANHADYFAFSDFENHGYTDVLEKRVASPVPADMTKASGIAREASNPIKPGTLQASYRYFHNNGRGFDLYTYRLNTGKNFAVLEVGDFDGDGAPDLLVAGDDGTQICLSPLGRAGALQDTAIPIVFTCDPGRPAVGRNTSQGMPYVIDIVGDGRSAHYSQIGVDGTAQVCIQGACMVDSSPPATVLASKPRDDGTVSLDVHDYTAVDQMVDFAGVGKPYDARWNRPHYQKYYVDVDGSQTPNPPELTWNNLTPQVTLTGFRRPGQQNVAGMFPYTYPKYPLPCPSVGCAPYRFEIPTQGGNISADFSGSGYNGLAFGFTETDSSNAIWRYKRADFTVCLSTGRALDCNVRKKYSGTGSYVAVRAIGNFVGDGQPSILAEVPFWQADMSPLGSGKVQMCRLLGDDTTAGQGVADDNMVCEDWTGLTLPRAAGSQTGDQIYLMDLLGTGRTQVVYYHAGTIDSQNRWSRNDSWEVFAPIDLAAPGQALDRIHQVTNGVGTVQSVEYADGLATGLVARTGDTDLASTYPQHLAAVPGKLVRKLSKGNGRKADGTPLVRSVTYRYADGATDVAGRGALGFRTVTTTDEQTGIVTTTRYRHVWPYTGMVQSELVSAGGVTLSNTVNEFGVKSYRQAGGAATLYPYVSRSTVTRHDLLGDAFDLGTTTTDDMYDDDGFGNLTSRTVTTVGGGETFVARTVTDYTNDAGAWLIGLPKTVGVTRTNPDQASLKRTTTYTYGAATGLLESETVEKGSVALEVKTEYVRTGNTFGQVSRKTQTWTDPVDGVVKSRDVALITYDANGRFPLDVSNAMGHKETHGTDPATGARTSHRDANGLVTTWTVDGFGRVGKELRPDGNETRISNTKKCAGDCRLGAPVVQVSENYHGAERISAPTVVYSDDVGHVLSTQSWGFKGDVIYTDRDYDGLGRLERTLQPAFANVPRAYLATRQEYDILNRVTKSVTLDDNNTERAATTEYQGMTRVLTNALTRRRTEQYNAIGQVKKVTDAKLGLTQFAYEPFGNLAKTIDPRGNVIDVAYDLLGRRLQLTDPDLDVIRYTVDPLGRVVAQSNPELRVRTDGNTSVKMVYDKLDRMTSRVEPELKSYWVYDTAARGVGRLAEAYTMAGTNKDYSRVHTYDAVGRASAVTQLLGAGGTSYVATPVYDAWSRVAGQRYKRGADAEKVFGLRYNDKGHLASVVREGLALWTVSEQDAANRPTTLRFGNATTQTLVYFPTSGRLQSTQVVGASQNQLLQEGYGYDALGSVLQRTQAWNGPSFTEDFRYDELGRLERSAIGTVEKLITYHADGSIKSKSGVGGGDYRYPTQGAGSKRPHAVEGFGAAPASFTYDLNGNLKTGMGRVVNWTTFDMPSSITKGIYTVSFVYGPEHQRTRQDRGVDSTVYAGGQEVESNGGDVKVKTYWPLGIGVEIDTVGKGTALYWIHKDRLGSPVAITDQTGVLQDPLAYDAWGKRRSQDGASTDDAIAGKVDNKGFTGHEMLDTVDLVHMNGRVYDPLLGRFLSADPLVQDPLNGQSYNRYSYVLNNPTNLTDPTGFEAEEKTRINVTGSALAQRSIEGAARIAELTGAKGTGLQRPAGDQNGGTVATNAGKVDANNNVKADGKNSANNTTGTPSGCRTSVDCSGNGNGYDKNDPNYHKYTIDTPICNTGTPGCTVQNVDGSVKKNAAPGSDGVTSLKDGDKTSIVFIGLNGGHVTHIVDDANSRVVNITDSDHVFYNGLVIRSVVSQGGVVSVSSYGEGVNKPASSWMPDALSKAVNLITAYPGFKILDGQIQRDILKQSPQGQNILQRQEIKRLESGYHGQ